MAQQWQVVEGAAKNDAGEYQALVGGKWQPASGAAKNADGKYMALMDAPVAEPSVMDARTNAASSAGAQSAQSGVRFDANRGLSTVSSRAQDISVNRAMAPKAEGETASTMAAASRFLNGSVSPRIADQERVHPKPEVGLANAVEVSGRYVDKVNADRIADRSAVAESNPYTSSLGAGAAHILSNVADTPAFVNDALKTFVVNPILHIVGQEGMEPTQRFAIAKDLQQAADEFTPETGKLMDLDFNNSQEVGHWVAVNALKNAPQIAIGYGASVIPKLRAAYLGLMGVTSGAGQYQRNLEKGVDQKDAMLDGVTNGAFEVIGEMTGFAAFDKISGIIKAMPVGQRAAIAQEAIKKLMVGVAATAGQMTAEGTGEGITQVGQNLSQKYVAGDKSVGLMDGVPDAVAIGAIMGTPTALHQGVQAARQPQSAGSALGHALQDTIDDTQLDPRAVTTDALRALSPTGSLPVPLTKMAADFSASQKAKATGVPHAVIAHPEDPAKFTAVPEPVAQDIAQKTQPVSIPDGDGISADDILGAGLGAQEPAMSADDAAMLQGAHEQGVGQQSDTTGLATAWNGFSDAMTEKLFAGLFDSLAQGKDTFAGIKDPAIARAKPYFEAGLITTPKDIQKFENEGYPQLNSALVDPVVQQQSAAFDAEVTAPISAEAEVDHFANGVTPEALDTFFADAKARHVASITPSEAINGSIFTPADTGLVADPALAEGTDAFGGQSNSFLGNEGGFDTAGNRLAGQHATDIEQADAGRAGVDNAVSQNEGKQLTYTKGNVVEMPVADLALSKDVPQFKDGADGRGITQESRLDGKFDRRLAAPVQVWQRANGDHEVISGRHRLDLAQRSGEDTIPVQIHRESDGFNADHARMLDVELNVKDGRGKVKDYVAYFKELNPSAEQAKADGLLNTAIGRSAHTIANAGSASLIASHANDAITDQAAVAIAQNAPGNEALQNLGMKHVIDGKSINFSVNVMRAARAAGFEGGGQSGDLFGFDDSFAKEAEAVSREATKQQNAARQQLAAISGASKRPEMARQGGVNVANPKATQAKIDALKQAVADLDSFATNPEIYRKLREDAGLVAATQSAAEPVEAAPETAQQDPAFNPDQNDMFGAPVEESRPSLELTGQTAEELKASTEAEGRAREADVQEAARRIREERDAADASVKASNVLNGNAADSFSLSAPEPVSKAQQKALDKKKAEAEMHGQVDLLSQSTNTATSTAQDGNVKQEDVVSGDRLDTDFRLNPERIQEALIERGELGKLHKAAGVRNADSFDGLPMDDRAAAYIKFVRQGGAPVEITEDYNTRIARAEHDSEVRRMQSDRAVRQRNGKPFKTEASAAQYQGEYDLGDTHKIVPVDGGFELAQLPPAQRPSERRRVAERQAEDPEMQRQEAAFKRVEAIGSTASGLFEKYENGDIEIDDFEQGLTALERPSEESKPADKITLMAVSNKPFPTEKSAQSSIKQRKLDATVVPVEGGFGIKHAPINSDQPGVSNPDRAAVEKANADFDDAMSDLGDIFGKNFRANFTPEQEQKILPVLTRLFDAAFRKGYYKFKDAARFVLDSISARLGKEVADEITIDHLQGSYIGMAGRYKDQGADSKRDVAAFESKDELGESNVTDKRSGTNLERDSGNANTTDGVGAQGVRDGRNGDGGTGGQGVLDSESEGGSRRSDGVPGRDAAADGERGNLEIYTGASPDEASIARDRVDQRSDSTGVDGSPIESDATSIAEELAESGVSLEEARAEQRKADAQEHKPGIENIRKTLPILTEAQQDDVHIAETRFAKPDGYGMLFTNGTGTGKTFTGLGIIKRFVTSGKSNIIITAPNDKIADDWKKAGRLLGLDITRLPDTKSAGKGVVIATYANFGQNNELAKRDWDLIVHDEAHYLAMDKNGTNTLSLHNLRAISMNPAGASTRASMLHADLIENLAKVHADIKSARESGDDRHLAKLPVLEAKEKALVEKWRAATEAVKVDVESKQGAARPRVLFLSATPFAYEKTVDWANGYLFDYNEGRGKEGSESRGYNAGSNSDQFMMQHFGYRMRYGKLTAPDAKVDSGLMQRQFNTMLKKSGVLSGRMLDVKADYDRRFVLVDSAIGSRIDAALQWFEDQRTGGKDEKQSDADKSRSEALRDLRDVIGEKFDYLSRRYLLEAIKAQEVIPHVKEHMALGRKVVVFHDYKKGGGFNPFNVSSMQAGGDVDPARASAFNAAVREFRTEFKDLIDSDVWRASSPITAFQQAFSGTTHPKVLLFNGDVSAKDRRAAVEKFQDDASGPQVILVQSAAGKEGISLHDTTGKHQRVLFNLGQPTQPTTAIQQEGRIYRTGQATDAIFRYLNTGTNWEKWAFATTIAQRASAAENLGMGEQARALKDAFITGFEESDDYRAGMEDEGKGGKERDRAANNALTEYDRARAFYFGTQKKNSRTKAQEGADYFATPEPVGLKMVELADIRPGESAIEPSAGHGAIARWMPTTSERSAIEPSTVLRPRLAMVFDGKIIGSNFEDLNVVNKYDAIVMNPPFGSGGRTAIDHLAKAATHLREGGRIVALIPTGPAADAKFDKWFYEESTKPVKPLGVVVINSKETPVYKGDTIASRATWAPAGTVTGWRDGAPLVKASAPEFGGAVSMVSKESILSVEPTGNRTESFNPTKGFSLVAAIALPSITFERAGTAVNTRIVVIERSANAPQQTSRDYTDATDINDLFDRMESLSISPRAKAAESIEEAAPPKRESKVAALDAQAKAKEAEAVQGGQIAASNSDATFEIKDGKLVTNAPAEKVVTGKGKELEGVFVPFDKLTQAQVKEADSFTYMPKGKASGWFVRLRHVERPAGNLDIKLSTQDPLADIRARYLAATKNGLSVDDVKNATAKLRMHWQGFRKVSVVQSLDDLPPDIRSGALRSGASDVEGIYDTKTKQVFLVADNLRSADRAAWVAIHEVVGHAGLRMLDAKVAEKIDYLAKNATVQKLAKAIATDREELFDQPTHSEEAVAELAAAYLTGGEQALFDRYGVNASRMVATGLRGMANNFVAAVRKFMSAVTGRKIEEVSDADVRAVIDSARKAVETVTERKAGIEQAGYGKALAELDASNESPVFSHEESAPIPESEWLSDGAIAQIIEDRLSQFKHQPKILIRGRVSDVLWNAARNSDGVVSGMVHAGKVHLFKEGMGSASAVTRTLWHELLHYGIRRFMTKEQYIASMQKLYSRDAWIKEKADAWVSTPDADEAKKSGMAYARARGVDEALADIAEKNAGENINNGVIAKTIRSVTTWAADLADRFGFTDAATKLRGVSSVEAKAFVSSVFGKLRNDEQAISDKWDFDADPAFAHQQPIGLNTPAQPGQSIPEETEFQKRQRQVQDKMNRFAVLQKWLKFKGVSLSEKADVHANENLMHAKIANQTQDFRDHIEMPLIERAAKAGFKLADIADYLEAQHIPEANARMRDIHHDASATANGITDAEANQALAEFQAMPKFAEFKKIADEFRAIGDETLSMRLREGLISRDQYDAYKNTYQHWVPLRGNGKKPGVGKGLSVNAKEKRRLGHGQREDGEMVIENLLMDRERAIYQVEHNRVGKSIIQFALEAKEPDMITVGKPEKRQVLKDQKVYEVQHKGRMMRAFSSESDAKAFINQAIALSSSRQGGGMSRSNFAIAKSNDPMVVMQASPMLAENEIQVYVAGHTIRVQLNDELLARAATNMGVDQVNSLLAAGRIINNGLSKIYTAYSPDFIFSNAIRDFIAGTINLTGDMGVKMAAKIYGNYGKAAKELFIARNDPRKSAWVQRYRAAGGNTGAAYLSDIERIGSNAQAAMHERMKGMEVYHTVHDQLIAEGRNQVYAHTAAAMKTGVAKFSSVPVLGHFLTLIEHLNAVTENALRLATYMTMVQNGYTEQQAAVAAKNSTVNFNRKGEVSNVMGAAYLFFNPSVQGSTRMFSSLLKSEHKGQAQAMAGMLAFAAFALAELGRAGDDDDALEWKNIPEWTKSHNLIFKFGELQWTIPVPYEFVAFHALGNALSDVVHGESAWKASMKVLGSLVDNLSPIGDPFTGNAKDGANYFQIMPTVVKMVMGPHENQNSFSAPIQPEKNSFSKNKPDSQNMFRNTAGTSYAGAAEWVNEMTGGSKYKAGGVDVSPEVLKFWVATLTGGTGRFVVDMGDAAYGATQGVAPDLRRTPIARVFVREASVADARARFWEAANEAKAAADELSMAKRDHNGSAVKEIRDAEGDMIRLSKLAGRMGKAASKKRDAIDAIRQDDQMPLEQKREKMKEIEQKEGEYYYRFLKMFDQKQKERREKAA